MRLSLITSASVVLGAFLSPLAAGDYLGEVKPLLQERCYACHGALKQKGGLRLDTGSLIKKGGKGGDATALLLERVTSTDPDERMPPEGEGSALTEKEIEHLRSWLAAGAPSPLDEVPESDHTSHWAFQLPEGGATGWEEMLENRLKTNQLVSQPPAAPEIWLRRVYLDLIGLPPTPEELAVFLAQFAQDPVAAKATMVDQLLASPHYGERWGRHFMDIWRYSDWYGLDGQLRHSQKHLWHWRDWIVESLQEDKGYDRMIVEMLAADELNPHDRANLRATGFLARGYYLFNRTTWLDETIEHTSRAFLGLTMQCAKCHDHKYDPIEQTDYYRFRAVFEPVHVRLDPWPGEPDLEKNGLPRVYDLHHDRATYRHVRGDEKNEDKTTALAPGVPNAFPFGGYDSQPIPLPPEAVRPVLLPFVRDDHLARAASEVSTARTEMEAAAQLVTPDPVVAEAKVPKAPPEEARILVSDDFREAKPDLWQMVEGTWRHGETGLRQSDTGATRRQLVLKNVVPEDFDVTFSFTIMGGQQWRSVGFSFDRQGESDVLVYLSAASPGSKLQIAFTNQGQPVYPPDALVEQKVVTDTRYTVRIQAKGPLMNVSVNDGPPFAYRLPQARNHGPVALVAFDADVIFHECKIGALPPSFAMKEPVQNSPNASPVPEPVDPALVLDLAKKKLAMAEAKEAMIRAVMDAERNHSDKGLAQKAAAAEALHQRCHAAFELTKLESQAASPDRDNKIKSAREALVKAEAKVSAPGDVYTSLRVTLKAQEGPDDKNNAEVQVYPEHSTGRRLALARWIASETNPLTARVLVNHVWLRHFGAPLVADVADFGMNAPRPLHQDVLDSLSRSFMDNGWSLKWLHRSMVLSDLYARSSSNAGVDATTWKNDPDNQYFWRMNPRRMESQVIRDSLLHVAGQLDLTLGGPALDPKSKEDGNRRSLYYVQTADVEHRFLAAFDNANVLECYRRNESIMPQQALALANSKLSRDCADSLATRLTGLADDDFIRTSFRHILGRWPTEMEVTISREGLSSLENNRPLFLQALWNHNDFITIR